MSSAAGTAPHASPGVRLIVIIQDLDQLVAAHPETLRRLFLGGTPTEPDAFGESPRGRILNVERARPWFVLTRPLVRSLSGALPWRGVTFDHGGNAGANVVAGKAVGRFHADLGSSRLDGAPALVLHYDEPHLKNSWPMRSMRDELRTVSPGLALSARYFGGSSAVSVWFGIESAAITRSRKDDREKRR